MLRRDVRFNGGRGAILCNLCRAIVKSNITREEINDTTPVFCKPCELKGKPVLDDFYGKIVKLIRVKDEHDYELNENKLFIIEFTDGSSLIFSTNPAVVEIKQRPSGETGSTQQT